jgi:hypothetical protein
LTTTRNMQKSALTKAFFLCSKFPNLQIHFVLKVAIDPAGVEHLSFFDLFL